MAAIEINMVELEQIAGWWNSVGPERRHAWLEFLADVRMYQQTLAGVEVRRGR